MDIAEKLAKHLINPENIKKLEKEFKEINDHAIKYTNEHKLPKQYVQALIIKHLFIRTKHFDLEIKDKIQCGNCSHCCYADVDLTNIEASIILAFIEESNLDIKYNEEINVFNKKACPLLKDGLCQVYEVRPLICRLHNSDDKKACAEDKSHGQFSEPNIIGLWALLSKQDGVELIKMSKFIEHLKTKAND